MNIKLYYLLKDYRQNQRPTDVNVTNQVNGWCSYKVADHCWHGGRKRILAWYFNFTEIGLDQCRSIVIRSF